MGPRSDERGNAASQAFTLAGNDLLQWGRAQMSAEIAEFAKLRAKVGLLQWGRAQMSAEMGDLPTNPGGEPNGFNGAALR